jgi:hypothetical protein
MGVCCSKVEVKEHIFYFNTKKKNEFDTESEEAWVRYDQNIQTFLNEKFCNYLNGGPAVVRLCPPCQNLQVDFRNKTEIDSKTNESRRIIFHEYTSSLVSAVLAGKIILKNLFIYNCRKRS